jgi:hypothetical protein
MSGPLSFNDTESILFRHKCLYCNDEGSLIVTTQKLCFVSNNPQSSVGVQLVWSGVDKTRYTPANDSKGRVMIMVQSTVQGSAPMVFQFLGDLIPNQRELERLKGIVSQVYF